MDIGYTAMGFFLNKTGRPIVYSCEWPFYQRQAGMKVLNSDQLLTVLDLKNALTMFYRIKGNFCVVQFPLNFMVSINPQKLKTNPRKLSRCPNVWIKMTTWPDSKVKDFWIISLAYAKSLLELIFGYNFFLFMNRFSKFLLHILGQKEYLIMIIDHICMMVFNSMLIRIKHPSKRSCKGSSMVICDFENLYICGY